jgi:hypothetical protein
MIIHLHQVPRSDAGATPPLPQTSIWRNAYVIKYWAALTCVLLLSQKATENIRIYSPLPLCQKPEAQNRPCGSMSLDTTFNSHPPSQPIARLSCPAASLSVLEVHGFQNDVYVYCLPNLATYSVHSNLIKLSSCIP